jgi:hypothetical protein
MTRSLGLCSAVLAAAIADPLVEFASNAGWFGPGNFTDRSNLDVGPVFALGIASPAKRPRLGAHATGSGAPSRFSFRDDKIGNTGLRYSWFGCPTLARTLIEMPPVRKCADLFTPALWRSLVES